MPLVALYNASCSNICIRLFIYLPRYFAGDTFKSLPGLIGLFKELLDMTTYSLV